MSNPTFLDTAPGHGFHTTKQYTDIKISSTNVVKQT